MISSAPTIECEQELITITNTAMSGAKTELTTKRHARIQFLNYASGLLSKTLIKNALETRNTESTPDSRNETTAEPKNPLARNQH